MKKLILSSQLAATIEGLEPRIAPASLITYTDVDGDTVKIKSSKGSLDGHVTFSAAALGQHLDTLDLTDLSFTGANITFIVKRGPTGDGAANVGFINAAGHDLGKVIVRGDLGQIDAGDSNAGTKAIKLLKAFSIGSFGHTVTGTDGTAGHPGGNPGATPTTPTPLTTPQLGGLVDLVGDIVGGVPVPGLVQNVLDQVEQLLVGDQGTDTLGADVTRLLGTLKADLQGLLTGATPGVAPSLTHLGGGLDHLLSHVANDAVQLLGLDSTQLGTLGLLPAQLGTLKAKLGTVLNVNLDAAVGAQLLGTGPVEPLVMATGLLGGLLGNGGLLGGGLGTAGGQGTGGISVNLPADLDLGLIFGHTLGSLPEVLAGTLPGTMSATMAQALTDGLSGLLGNVSQGVDGLLGLDAANLNALPADLRTLLSSVSSNLGEVLGGTGALEPTLMRALALVQADANSLHRIADNTVGFATQEVQNLLGTLDHAILNLLGPGTGAGGGGGTGGGTSTAVAISSDILGDVGRVIVRNDVDGVFLNVRGNIGKVNIGGSLAGGDETNSGSLFASGNVNKFRIGKNIVGGDAVNAGSVVVNGALGKMYVGGSLVGGDATNAGSVSLQSDAGVIRVRGDLIGQEGLFSGSIDNANGGIRALIVRGSVIGAEVDDAAAISVTDAIRSLQIGRDVIGDGTHIVSIAAGGMHSATDATDYALKNVRIGGQVQHSNILAGFSADTDPTNGSAQIGKLFVRGNFLSSSVSAGVEDALDNGYGNDDDRVIADRTSGLLSRIASITIRGAVFGSQEAGDHYGFVAADIGTFQVGPHSMRMTAASPQTITLSSTTDDVTVHEVRS